MLRYTLWTSIPIAVWRANVIHTATQLNISLHKFGYVPPAEHPMSFGIYAIFKSQPLWWILLPNQI